MKEHTTPKDYFFITIIMGVFGGCGAYLGLRNRYPKEAKQLLMLGVGISVIWVIVIAAVNNDDSTNDNTKQISQQTTSQTKETEKITTSSKEQAQLPASCKGVDSMDTDLYPTGKECISELYAKIILNCGFDEACIDKVDRHLSSVCGNDKVCTMSSLQYIYRQLGNQ